LSIGKFRAKFKEKAPEGILKSNPTGAKVYL